MNYKNLSPEERAERARARKLRERRRYAPIRLARQKAKRRADVMCDLGIWAWVPMIMERLPNPKLYSLKWSERRRAVREIKDMEIFMEFRNDIDPDHDFLACPNRNHCILDPTIRLRAYRPHSVHPEFVVEDPKELADLYKVCRVSQQYLTEPLYVLKTPWLFDHDLDLDGLNWCARCQQKGLRLIRRPGQDTIWHCWGCGRSQGSAEHLGQRRGHDQRHWATFQQHFFVCTMRGARVEFRDYWAGLINKRADDILGYGRIFYQKHSVQRGFPVAFGDWAHLSRESLESIPTVGRVTRAEFKRNAYLIRILRATDGRLATLHIHSEKYKPLFTHYFLPPTTPQLEVPWWAARRPWDGIYLTHDRAQADRMERHEVRKPHAERMPVGLLPSGADLKQFQILLSGCQTLPVPA